MHSREESKHSGHPTTRTQGKTLGGHPVMYIGYIIHLYQTACSAHSSNLFSSFLLLAYNVNTAKPSVTTIRPSTIGLSTTTLIPPTTMRTKSTTSQDTDSLIPPTPLITVRPDTSTTTTSFQSLQTTITNNDFQTTTTTKLIPDDVSESTFITSDTVAFTVPVSVVPSIAQPSLIDILTGNENTTTVAAADTITNTTTPLPSRQDFPTFPNFPLATENDQQNNEKQKEVPLLFPDFEIKESEDTTTTSRSRLNTTTTREGGSPLPLFNDTDFTTSKPTSAETTEYNSVRDTTTAATTTTMMLVPEFAVVSDTTPIVNVSSQSIPTTTELASFSDILAANLPTVDDVSLAQTDTVVDITVTTKEMINPAATEAIPDFSVYDTDTFSKGLRPDYDTENTILDETAATSSEIQKPDFEIYDTLRDVKPINQATKTMPEEEVPDFSVYEMDSEITDSFPEVEHYDASENAISDGAGILQPDFEIFDTIRDIQSNQAITSMPEEEFAIIDTVESTTFVSNTDYELIPEFGIIEFDTPNPSNVSNTKEQLPDFSTNTTTVSNAVNDAELRTSTISTTVSNTAVTTTLQGDQMSTFSSVVLEDTFELVPDLSVFQTIRELTTPNPITEDQSPVDGTTLSLFLQSLFNQLSQSSPSNVSVPESNFNFTEALFNSLNQTLEKVPEEEGQAFSSLLFQSLPPLPPTTRRQRRRLPDR